MKKRKPSKKKSGAARAARRVATKKKPTPAEGWRLAFAMKKHGIARRAFHAELLALMTEDFANVD